MDERGEYIGINDVLLLLYYYLHEYRGERGGIVRNLATTHVLDRLAHHFHEECYEVPVGFKHIAAAMKERGELPADWVWKNPRITLDDGRVVWGCQCWWGPEEAIRKRIEGLKIIPAKTEE